MRKKPKSPMSWLNGRETGQPPPVGERDALSSRLYSSVRVVDFWSHQALGQDENHRGIFNFDFSTDGPHAVGHDNHHGIFNFDFSTDGKVLVAACEGKSFLVFDANNHRLVKPRRNAHTDCVNCVRFLDTRSFVTCSDDTTVVLWDLRFLKNKVRVFAGHTSWVKNIEYASSQGSLITSGFDGTVYSWNINNYSKDEECQRKFYTEGLMRCKLTPDDSKLVLSTSRGYLMIVHDLDLPSLSVDMDGYKLDATVPRPKSVMSRFCSLFKRDTNRLEIINEFPARNDAENIASLQVHPQGWCVVSRNNSKDDTAEWTCVHDIHTHPELREREEEENEEEEKEEDTESEPLSTDALAPSISSTGTQLPPVRKTTSFSSARCRHHPYLGFLYPERPLRANGQGHSDGAHASSSASSKEGEEEVSNSEPSGSSESCDSGGCCDEDCTPCSKRREGEDLDLYGYFLKAQWGISLHTKQGEDSQTVIVPRDSEDLTLQVRPRLRYNGTRNNVYSFDRFLRSTFQLIPPKKERGEPLYRSQPRLLYYREEPNVGRGFIKEQCFSSDGRLVVSPCGNGIRLLAFDERCRELCDCEQGVEGAPRSLRAVTEVTMHPNVVLTCCCSPTHPLVVTGSLDGSVAFLMPRP
ncbi:hypothetical protein ACOMHN_035847 [Nucella lapillus]